MRRALLAIFGLTLVMGGAGCLQRPCAPGTVLVALDFAGATTVANRVDVIVSVAGAAALTRSLARDPGASWGTIEVAFAEGYPHRKTVSLQIVARVDSLEIGAGSKSYVAGESCDSVEMPILTVVDDLAAPPADVSAPLDVSAPPDAVDLAPVAPADLAPAPPPGICSADHWCWVNPLPQGNGLVQTFGFGPDNIWAVGSAGTILNWNGSVWRSYPGVTQEDLWSVWGVAPDDVWIGGQGVLAHFDGKSWQLLVDESPVQDTFVSFWGSAGNDVYAIAGTTNVIGHWDGTSWTMSNVGGSDEAFTGISGTGPDDVWVVGSQLWHSDGTGFTPAATQPPASHGPGPASVYAVAPGDAWLVGPGGTILHWSGGAFTAYPGVTAQFLQAVWGSGANDVWACGSDGTVVHWDGSAWQASYSTGTTAFLSGGWSGGANDVWIAGDSGTLIHYDGSSFSSPTNGLFTDLAGIWGSAINDIWIVGANGTTLHYDGMLWSPVPSGTTNALTAVWGSGANDVWAVGLGGTILHWSSAATGWQPVNASPAYDLNAVWGSRGNDVWAVGSLSQTGGATSAEAPILHWDGSAWSGGYTFASPFARLNLNGVRSMGENGAVLAVGDGDAVLYDTASLFASYPGSGTVWNVASLANDLEVEDTFSFGWTTFAVGSDYIYSYYNGTWTASPTPDDLLLYGLFGFADNDFYAVGSAYGTPAVLHWNGSLWSTEAAGVDALSKVWGATPNDLWAIGRGGTILRKQQ